MTVLRLSPLLLLLALPVRAAGPAYWDFPEQIPLTDCDLQGAALDEHGRLVPGLAAESFLADSSLVFWRAVAGPDDKIYVGSGHDGQVWRLDGGQVARVDGAEVFSLLPWRGGLLAGCGPGGQVYEIQAGDVQQRALVPGGYVWALDGRADGPAYLATGSPAAVYELKPGGSLDLLAELPARNALDIAMTDRGDLLVTTQGPGFLFRLPADDLREPELLLEIDQDEARQVVRGPDGWYVLGLDTADNSGRSKNGSGQQSGDFPFPGDFDLVVTPDSEVGPVRSALYVWPDDGGVPHRVWASDRELMIAAWSEAWGWLGSGKRDEGGPTTVARLTPPSGVWPVAQWDGGDVIDLLVLERGAGVIVSQANPGRVTRLGPADGEAVALGPPLDGGVPIAWSRLRWQGEKAKLAVRTGNSATPDETWSDWSGLSGAHDRELDVAPSRFLQWKVVFAGDGRVDAISVSGTEPNLAPQITVLELQPQGDIVMGGLMSSSENATQRLADGLKIEYNRTSQRDRTLPRDRAAQVRPLRTFTWHATDPNEDRLWFALAVRAVGETAWRPLGERMVDPLFTWDTTEVPDGRYEVQLTVTDAPDNPAASAQTTSRSLPPFTVDNTAPDAGDLRLERTADGFRVRLDVRDAETVLAGADVQLPDGTSERFDPVDGVCDELSEHFDRTLRFPREDSGRAAAPWRVRVRVWDLAGNLTAVSGSLAP